MPDGGAVSQLCHRLAVKHLPGGGVGRDGRNAIVFPPRDLRIINQHVTPAGVEIDPDGIAGPDIGQAAAGSTFR